MQRYSINKSGKNYIVQADEKDVLICKSRREAVKMISDANGLMEASTSHNKRRADAPKPNPS